MEQLPAGAFVPPLKVRTQGTDRILAAGPSYTIGRGLDCDVVINDVRVSRRHAVLRLEGERWVLADCGSTNGLFAGDQRVDRIEIIGTCLVRIGHPVDGLPLSCAVSEIGPRPRPMTASYQVSSWPAARESGRPQRVDEADGDQGASYGDLVVPALYCAPRSTRAAMTCSGC